MTVRQHNLLEELGLLLGQALVLLAPDGSILARNKQAEDLLLPSILSPPKRAESVFAEVLRQLQAVPPATAIESCLEIPGAPPLRCRATLNIGPPPTALIALCAGSALETASFEPEVLSILNHEFRTPLATLCGFAELMLNRTFDEATKRTFLQTIRSESFRLARLFKNLIDLQRTRSKDFLLHLETVELGALVERACGQRRQADPDRRIELTVPSRPITTRLDPVKMSRVLEILLENGSRLSGASDQLDVAVRSTDRELVVSVATHGSGIPIEAAREIFLSNYRPKQTDWPRFDGFSLPLAKAIIEAHRGRVWVETDTTQRSVLGFSLPLPKSPDKA